MVMLMNNMMKNLPQKDLPLSLYAQAIVYSVHSFMLKGFYRLFPRLLQESRTFETNLIERQF